MATWIIPDEKIITYLVAETVHEIATFMLFIRTNPATPSLGVVASPSYSANCPSNLASRWHRHLPRHSSIQTSQGKTETHHLTASWE